MFLHRSSRAIRHQWRLCRGLNRTPESQVRAALIRGFHASRNLQVVKPVLLADIGEGIVECEIIQWFVEPNARVEEFSPLCEVQSDKASVEITSRFSGVVKKLYYEAGEMAKVGKPFVDIDIQGGASQEALDALTTPESSREGASEPLNKESLSNPPQSQDTIDKAVEPKSQPPPVKKGKYASLATPAVRHRLKELNIDIMEVEGTGKDGRVLKEDIYKFVEKRDSPTQPSQPTSLFPGIPPETEKQTETAIQLTNTQQQMFKTMTRSLAIPHFLYADEIDFSQLVELRRRLNKVVSESSTDGQLSKLTYLPFIVKAVSIALHQYPILNARVDVDPETSKPRLVHRSQHNIGVAMDTPSGLIVPVIKNAGAKSILSIAAELSRLQSLAAAGKLSPQDLSGGTITVSNIGNIGGTYVSPVIVEKEVAILGVGRMRTVPAFDDQDNVVKKQVCNFSWCADHRVVDGATMARAAEVVRKIVEEPDIMVLHLR
ncbi:Lipoamide acyltransferase component of branched-chain alpha-keto acid dehydrogenase complex, mitochondrial [Daldinia childiae]|uniref:Lipoamide acyltransferase component of branched-chain alpha-keto acid dehydrogenase complex, mitochondrial n=1 Tax=Daldinia childiae TaxID=326645 RepID=UPI001444FB5A|nr:Lipoamide acyltransferase component of branched-chain alpha-keto acid dehydrogenase complex, mitochondrial [Daldinia childiae]KAF3056341.1 Lipoamide acyltransferase component of branched-chain alpha-keto acid dehydrogenase complex, mitochondrial [Daldinia childiae]